MSFSNPSFTQNNNSNNNREAIKIAFYTKKMNLSSEESQIFWPIVNEMEKKLKKLKIKTLMER